jgi:hypothetical protein
MAKKNKDEEEVIVALVIGILLATIVIFMFATKV